MKPNGWAIGPLRPVKIGPAGQVDTLPVLKHPSGTLDGLLWIGGKGLALAAFGSSGSYYRPERGDTEPTLALVDAARGRILASVPFRSIGTLRNAVGKGLGRVAISRAVGRLDARGRAIALFAGSKGPWVVWRQGQAVQDVAITQYAHAQAAIHPDGTSALFSTGLQPDNVVIVEHAPSPPPTPQTGVVAALHDLKTGKALWTLNATASHPSGYPAPAISHDAKFAIIGMPEERNVPRFALISLRDGRILRTLRGVWNSGHAIGFTNDGRRFWISGGSSVAMYLLPASINPASVSPHRS